MSFEADIAGEIADEGRLARQEAAEKLTELALCNEMLSPLEKRKKELTDWLKQYMALEGLDFFEGQDAHEQPITARFQDRKGTPTYDLVSLVKDGPGVQALASAAQAGMARIDHSMLKRYREKAGASWADLVAKYEMPGTGTTALVIEKR